jgi:hypothetical protein
MPSLFTQLQIVFINTPVYLTFFNCFDHRTPLFVVLTIGIFTFTNQFNIESPKVGNGIDFKFKERNMHLYRLPSSSRAYPIKVEIKAEYYRKIFNIILNK